MHCFGYVPGTQLRISSWMLQLWCLLSAALPRTPLSMAQSTNSTNVLHDEGRCTPSGTSFLLESCEAVRNGVENHAVWNSLTKLTRDCTMGFGFPQNQSASAYDVFGIFWRIGTQPAFENFLVQFNNETGLYVGSKFRTIAEYIRNWLDVWPTPSDPGPYDYWLISAEVFGETIGQEVFVDLAGFLLNDESYRLIEIPARFRDAGSSAYAGGYSALPLWITSYQLMYRRDVFEAHGIPVPRTWDEALAIADKYGKGALGHGEPDLGFCFESNPGCGYAHAMFMYLVGSMVQLQGPSHGTWFDPTNMEPLYGNPTVFREAIRLFLALKAHSVPDSNPCFAVYDMLASGRCLMLWGFSFAFKRASHNSSGMSGRQGVAPTPGSVRVLDRNSPNNGLVPCTRDLCPYAELVAYLPSPPSALTDNRSRSSSSTTSSKGNNSSSSSNGGGGNGSDGGVLVNRIVPIETGSFAINRFAPLHRQAGAFLMLHEFTGPNNHKEMMLELTTEVTPLRMDELDEKLWVTAGYDSRDVKDFLDVYRRDFQGGNVYYELRIPGVFKTYVLIQTMLFEAIRGNATNDQLLVLLQLGTEEVFQGAGGRQRLLPLYRRSLDYSPPPPLPPPAQGQSNHSDTILLAALIPTAAVLVAAAAALWGFLRLRRKRNERRAKICGAPGVGAGTTLLVTDIQDSTALWESLAAEVMDASVKLHHRVIRELLVMHTGYESATEGDSFILAFHGPERALRFAVAAQETLLNADWPTELLASPYAAQLVVRHNMVAAINVATTLAAPPVLREALNLDQALCQSSTLAAMPSSQLPSHGASSSTPQVDPLRQSPLPRPQCPRGSRNGAGGGSDGGDRRLRQPSSLEVPGWSGLALPPATIPPRPCSRQRSASVDGRPPITFTRTPAVLYVLRSDGVSSVGSLGAEEGAGMPDSTPQISNRPRISDSGGRMRRTFVVAAAMIGDLAASKKTQRATPSSLWQLYGSSAEDGSGVPRSSGGIGSGCRSTGPGALGAATAPRSDGGRADACSLCGREGGGKDTDRDGGGSATAIKLMEALSRVFLEEGVCDTISQPTGRVILFRGLRVRMGLDCGIDNPGEVQYNRASGRIVYPSPTLQLTKAVADSGHGGQITLTRRAQRAAINTPGRFGGSGGGSGGLMSSGVSTPYVVLSLGSHVLTVGGIVVELYGVYSKGLVARAAHLRAVRTVTEKIPSVLSAPLGRVAVALAQVQDPDDFAGWGLEVSLDSHKGMLREAGTLACGHGGYLVPTPPGSFQAVFCNPRSAVQWILELQDDLGPSTDTLMSDPGPTSATSESGVGKPPGPAMPPGSPRPVSAPSPAAPLHCPSSTSGSVDPRDPQNRLQRATAAARLSLLCIKGGVAVGNTMAALSAGGSISYSGGAAKRAACLAASAAWHEVLVTMEVVRAVCGKDHPALLELQRQEQLTGSKSKNRSNRCYQLAKQPVRQLCPPVVQLQLPPPQHQSQQQQRQQQESPASGRLRQLPPPMAAAASMPLRALLGKDFGAGAQRQWLMLAQQQQKQQQEKQQQQETQQELQQEEEKERKQQKHQYAPPGQALDTITSAVSTASLTADVMADMEALLLSLPSEDSSGGPLQLRPLRPGAPSVPVLPAPTSRPPIQQFPIRTSLPGPSSSSRQQQAQQEVISSTMGAVTTNLRPLTLSTTHSLATRPLLWGTGLQKIKFKGGTLLACTVRLDCGAVEVAAPPQLPSMLPPHQATSSLPLPPSVV